MRRQHCPDQLQARLGPRTASAADGLPLYQRDSHHHQGQCRPLTEVERGQRPRHDIHDQSRGRSSCSRRSRRAASRRSARGLSAGAVAGDHAGRVQDAGRRDITTVEQLAKAGRPQATRRCRANSRSSPSAPSRWSNCQKERRQVRGDHHANGRRRSSALQEQVSELRVGRPSRRRRLADRCNSGCAGRQPCMAKLDHACSDSSARRRWRSASPSSRCQSPSARSGSGHRPDGGAAASRSPTRCCSRSPTRRRSATASGSSRRQRQRRKTDSLPTTT